VLLSTTRRALALAAVLVFVLMAAGLNAPSRSAATTSTPAILGDHPDPTVVRVGDSYYASATSGQWAPVFPIFRSKDLAHWQQVGSIFPQPPKWTKGHYWAPELVRWNGRMVAFYSVSRQGGKPCIAVASAARPEGPWRDRGAALCLPSGTIDAAPFTDDDGSRWLLYKAMGVGGGLWIVRFDDHRLRTVGRPTLLIKPDKSWEQGTTEGPALIHRNGQYHLFYAAGHCCRPPCTYSEAVARSNTLLGPYTKSPAPIMRGDANWKCPGHGTLLDLGSRGLMLFHHAYRADDPFNSRRSVLLTPISFGADGWATMGAPGSGLQAPATRSAGAGAGFSDPVAGAQLQPGWEWPFDQSPALAATRYGVRLSCMKTRGRPSYLARQVERDAFTADARVAGSRGSAAVGLGIVDPGWGMRGVELRAGKLREMRSDGAGVALGPAVPAPAGPVVLHLDVRADGSLHGTATGAGGQVTEIPAGPAATGGPPTRLALTCRGTGSARFTSIRATGTA
jgi:GH43 family beta-xylosidase